MSELWLYLTLLCAPDTTVSARSVVEEAMAQNPSVAAAVLDYRRSQQDVGAEELRYLPSLILSLGATHTESPSLRATGGVAVPLQDNYQLASELRHTFSFGTALALRLEGSRVSSEAQFGAGGDQLVILGPGYGLASRLSLTQPILRGFGDQVGEATLRQARLNRTAAQHARDLAASQVLRDVSVAYWELWYSERAHQIDEEAFSLAVRQRDEALARIGIGALAKVEAYAFRTRVAELEQQLAVSEATVLGQSLELERLLGRSGDSGVLHAQDSEVPVQAARSPSAEAEAAVQASAELAQLQARLQVALDQAMVAGETERPRLDVDAYLQAQGLGNQEVLPAFEQFGRFDALSAHVGLTLELPLTGARYRAEQQSAALAAAGTRARLQSTEQQLRSSATAEVVRLEQARRRIELATRTVQIATESVKAQEERYQRGDAILLQVYEAQDTLRRAQLSLERSRVDAVQAALRLDHLKGSLLGQSTWAP